MDEVLSLGLDASRWLQEMYPALREFMLVITNFGRFEVYLLLLPLIYWCIDKKRGAQLSYLLVISTLLNAIGKHLLRTPRPHWLDASLELVEANSYGVPSGHTQTAVVVALFFVWWVNRAWALVLALIYIGLMGLSRVYLGVHFLHDIVAGFFLGCLILLGFAGWRRWLRAPFYRRILGQRLLGAVGFPLVLGAVWLVGLLMIGSADSSVQWASRLPLAEEESMEAVVEMVAAMLGMGVGFLFEQSVVYYRTKSFLPQYVLRYFLGMAGALAIWLGLRIAFAAITPDGFIVIALALRFIRYFLLTLWISYYAPKIFTALRFADQNDMPDVSFGVDGAVVRESKE